MNVEDFELEDWLRQRNDFQEPPNVRQLRRAGTLRLIIQQWHREIDSGSQRLMPMSEHSWTLISEELELPPSFIFDFATRKHIPLRITKYSGARGRLIGKSIHEKYIRRNTRSR